VPARDISIEKCVILEPGSFKVGKKK
jgi:hypothetical protein